MCSSQYFLLCERVCIFLVRGIAHYLISQGKHRRLNTQFNSIVNLNPVIYPFSVVASYSLDFFFFVVHFLSMATRVIPITSLSPLTDYSALSSYDTAYPFHHLPSYSSGFVTYSFLVEYLPSSSVVLPFLHPRFLGYPILFRSLMPSLFSFTRSVT